MTSSLLSPRKWRQSVDVAPAAQGSDEPTRILDWRSDAFAAFAGRVGDDSSPSTRDWLCDAYAAVSTMVRPAYALNDLQRTSKTLRRGRGSCSQRLAVLEALARRQGISTRVEGIAVDGRFWYPRFPRLSWAVPERVVLAWPEFKVNDTWLAVGDLFTPEPSPTRAFNNAGEETLFDAIGRTSITWRGDCSAGSCDLSDHVAENLGYFDSRDDLFAAHGQTLCWAARTVGEPIMSHRTANPLVR